MAEFNFATDAPQASASQSFQGQLASGYTNWVNEQVQTTLKDFIGFLVYTEALKTMSQADAIKAGQAAMEAIDEGKFSVTDLFNAGQTKTNPLPGTAYPATDLGDLVSGSPAPKLFIEGFEPIDLTQVFTDPTSAIWTTTSGSGKNASTTYHMREYFEDTKQPDGYEAGWADPVNAPPTATPIQVAFDETQSLFDSNNERTNTNPDIQTVDLLDTASDPDGDPMTVSDVVFIGGQPSYIVFNQATNSLEIDLNSRELDDLKLADDPLTFTVTYTISDGKGGSVSNTAEITINGTTDLYQGSGSGSTSVTHTRSEASDDKGGNGGNINGNVLTITTPEDSEAGFDYTLTGGTISVTSSGLTGNQSAGVSDGGEPDWGDAIGVDLGVPTAPEVELLDTALDDGQIDYNVRFNKADDTDSVTITVNYEYDYWYLA